MMNLHQEHHFEREICTHLAANSCMGIDGLGLRPQQPSRRQVLVVEGFSTQPQ